MESHLNLTDGQFEYQFRDGSLDPALFSHEAHIRLAWIHTGRYGVEQACVNVCDQIQAFDRLHGDGTKFHRTLTVAAVRAVHHFRQKSVSDTFSGFIREFPRLKTNFKDLLNAHYSHFILRLPRAKREYLEPDLLPFS
ncbi:hypothetical protein [Flavilitoribacter nigricans]|uniref:Uncharacterized protein n=1 Tax=Flavilitoribacter nigricans (strain ATCC 23147 / DSM 23189 / NBRC 102662 / NCIMB 1420 / SS-2) TaxID=1122177 RepID=A0A2D0MY67_FLAN2|nr:hypothetical protein [Flavilitoribacter nigricans]PHN01157.1 hypothetical protein CRP01_38425 [Flavilitoribacter nigricans DSM 23189 = NBRC 102662]